MSTNIFEKASRQKLRFSIPMKGLITVEDLWDLSLETLNDEAKRLNKYIKEHETADFIPKPSGKKQSMSEHKLKFNIVLFIIETKLEELKEKEEEIAKKAQKEKIMDLISKKKDQELEDLDVKDLKKMLKDL